MHTDEMLTTAEAARILRLSPAALRQLVALGRVTASRPGAGGRVFRFKPADLAAYVDRNVVAPRDRGNQRAGRP